MDHVDRVTKPAAKNPRLCRYCRRRPCNSNKRRLCDTCRRASICRSCGIHFPKPLPGLLCGDCEKDLSNFRSNFGACRESRRMSSDELRRRLLWFTARAARALSLFPVFTDDRSLWQAGAVSFYCNIRKGEGMIDDPARFDCEE